VIIKIEKTGGLAGISTSRQIDADRLTGSLESTAKKLLYGTNSPMVKVTSPKGAADLFSYKITLQDGTKNRVIECNEFGMDDDLRSLVRYVESKSRK